MISRGKSVVSIWQGVYTGMGADRGWIAPILWSGAVTRVMCPGRPRSMGAYRDDTGTTVGASCRAGGACELAGISPGIACVTIPELPGAVGGALVVQLLGLPGSA